MKGNLRVRLYFISAIILLVGLGSAVFIYLEAEDASDNLSIEQFENSKIYKHDLELYGGKLNLLANDFSHWFEGLWHGKNLSYTVAFITIFISLGFLLIAYYVPS